MSEYVAGIYERFPLYSSLPSINILREMLKQLLSVGLFDFLSIY